MEDYINPNSIDGDDFLEEEEDLNNNQLFLNNGFYFTKDDFIESIDSINDPLGIMVIVILLGVE